MARNLLDPSDPIQQAREVSQTSQLSQTPESSQEAYPLENIAKGLGAALSPAAFIAKNVSLQDLDDAARVAAKGASFGYADPIAGYLSGTGTDAQRRLTKEARERLGTTGEVIEFAAPFALPFGMASKGATLIGKFGSDVAKGLPGVLSRMGLAGAEGAGYGALYAGGNDQNVPEGAIMGALGGSLGSGAVDAISSAGHRVATALMKRGKLPSPEEIAASKDAAYRLLDSKNARFSPESINNLKSNIMRDMEKGSYLRGNQPRIGNVLREMDRVGRNPAGLTLDEVDSLRRMASNAYAVGDRPNNALSYRIIDNIDNMISGSKAEDLVSGTTEGLSEAFKEAKRIAAQSFKMDDYKNIMYKVDNRSSTPAIRANALRSNFRKWLEKGRGLTPDERSAMETLIRGSPTSRAAERFGRLSPTQGVIPAIANAVGIMANPVIGGAASGAAYLSKGAADNLTERMALELSDIIRAGGSRAAAESATKTLKPINPGTKEAITRALMAITASSAPEEINPYETKYQLGY